MAAEMQTEAREVEPIEAPAQTLYPLDDQVIQSVLRKGKLTLTHRLRRPTVSELHERGQLIQYEIEDVSDEETREVYDEDPGDLRLWDRIATDVQGYRAGNGYDAQSWLAVSTTVEARGCAIKDLIPKAHKTAAVKGYLSSVKAHIERDEEIDGAFDLLAAPEIRVVVTVGRHEITHVVRQPSEEEWTRYDRRVLQQTNIKGATRPKTRIRGNITAAIELYDSILSRIEGASLGSLGWADQMRAEFVAAVDPWHKRQVIFALAADYGVKLGN